MLEQIQLLKSHIQKIELEIGDIARFKRPNQLLAFAGLDASVRQSGDLTRT